MSILEFSTALFGTSPAEGLDGNPKLGHALAEMLRLEFQALNYETDDVVAEEAWGWSFYMQYYHRRYMIGTFAYSDTPPIPEKTTTSGKQVKYLVQFDKKRSFKERLFGQNKFAHDEPIIELTAAILKFKITDMTDFSRQS